MSGNPDDSGGLMLFGRDIERIPCFRNSYLYGILGGIGCGLAYFMFTSRSKTATHFAVGSFCAITLGYWTQCRYKYAKAKFEMRQLQQFMQERNVMEGVDPADALRREAERAVEA